MYGDPFSFSFFFFYTMFEPLPHAPNWMFFNLDGHTFHLFWYCKKRADSRDAVFAEHVSQTSWPFFFFCFCFFSLLSYFRSILGTLFSVDYTYHVASASTFPCVEKCFWNKWKKKNSFCIILSIQIYRFSVFDLRE